ncbi:MAG: 3'(2'),5'-bisphosphate nucleotidase CysQ [Gammaproteobacteria bacterium]
MNKHTVDLAFLDDIVNLARDAGRVITEIYATDFAVSTKSDASPVTLADQRAEALILAGLKRLTPEIAIVAEESVAAGQVPQVDPASGWFWLVDPLDGTREFASRNGEFTVNIALVYAGEPVLGVVLAPAINALYAGARGLGAYKAQDGHRFAIQCRAAPAEGLAVVESRSHGDGAALDAWLQGRPIASRVKAGSSLKLCLLAEGRADLYPRLGRTMEWDIAAGHAVLAAAGGRVIRVDDGRALRYGKPGFENPGFVAEGC